MRIIALALVMGATVWLIFCGKYATNIQEWAMLLILGFIPFFIGVWINDKCSNV